MSVLERMVTTQTAMDQWIDNRYGAENRALTKLTGVMGVTVLGLLGLYTAHKTGINVNGPTTEALIEIGAGSGIVPTGILASVTHEAHKARSHKAEGEKAQRMAA